MSRITVVARCALRLLLLCTLSLAGAAVGTSAADPAEAARPDAPAERPAPSREWCRAQERRQLALVEAITESVLLNLRIAMQRRGAPRAEVREVMMLVKHPAVTSYVEQQHGRTVMQRYEALLEAVRCLEP